jgi:coenzyme F420-dependent glucose-6-phosphate dehydrogenase
MPDTRFWFAASTEEFLPSDMVEHAKAAAQAGFDGLASSDHFAPWWPEGRGSQAWVTLSAMGAATPGDLPLGTSVTPVVCHYHPGVVAQAFMSLEDLYPDRVFLGAGSGEALNEVPLGCDWPPVAEQVERMDKGLEAIRRLWDGETVTMDGGWFRLKEAKLYTRARSGRPRLYVSAFGPKAAAVAAKHGDGLWTLGDPQKAPEVIAAYKDACARHGREPGEVILQSGFHLADDERAAIARAKKWKATQLPEMYTDDIHDPAEMFRMAEERMSDEEFAHKGFLVGADAEEHVERIREMQYLGATVICLQLIGDADPLGSIRRYGEEVLPRLGGGREARERRFAREGDRAGRG